MGGFSWCIPSAWFFAAWLLVTASPELFMITQDWIPLSNRRALKASVGIMAKVWCHKRKFLSSSSAPASIIVQGFSKSHFWFSLFLGTGLVTLTFWFGSPRELIKCLTSMLAVGFSQKNLLPAPKTTIAMKSSGASVMTLTNCSLRFATRVEKRIVIRGYIAHVKGVEVNWGKVGTSPCWDLWWIGFSSAWVGRSVMP